MPKRVKKKRELLCKDCRKRRQEQGRLVGTMVLTQCQECGRETHGLERAYCNECAEVLSRCTWCGEERD